MILKNLSISHVTAGLVAVLVGFTSTAAIVFQAAITAGATPAHISSWILALGFGMGLTSIGLSLYYRIPILIAWSTPGAALLITSLAGVSMPQAIGIFMFSAVLVIIAGATGWFERIMSQIPKELAAAMLAGILLQFGINIFVAMQSQLSLVGVMFITYLLGKRFASKYTIIVTLSFGILVAWLQGLFNSSDFAFAMATPIFVAPEFSWPLLLSVGIPLFVVTMTSQNIPGLAVLRSAGYKPPISPIITWSGIITLLLAPFGGFAFNLAVIILAFCTGKEADPDVTQRYKAAMCAGAFNFAVGLVGATVVALFAAFPKELIAAMAGLALLATMSNSLQTALADEKQREPALITFLVSASGISLFGIGAAFWGLVMGVIASMLFAKWKVKAVDVVAATVNMPLT